jgi:hypothetical protein
MHTAIRNLVQWQPLTNPEPGYTVVIGCMRALAPVARANLTLIGQMQLEHMREIIAVFDCTEDQIPPDIVALIDSLRKTHPIRLLSYSREQARIAAQLKWGWVYAWLSWCLGIAAARTRHVILHDLDALPVNPRLFDVRYAQALAVGSKFHGSRWYQGNGVDASMQLAVTFELVLDAQHLRSRFDAFDGFNHVALVDGTYIDFDTFLYIQSRSDTRTVDVLPESDLVHPSQMICQFTDFVAGRNDFRASNHNLMMLPYYAFLGGDAKALDTIGAQCAEPGARSVPFAGKSLSIAGIEPSLWAWHEKQIRRMEHALHGRTRPEVEQYLLGFVSRAGETRSVGREAGSAAVAAG